MKIGLCNCAFCGIEFTPSNSRNTYCSKVCISKKWYRDNPESVLRKRNVQNQNPERMMIYRVKSRALSTGVPFNITEEDIYIPEVCPVLGVPLIRHLGYRGYKYDSPSLDRIVPTKGYVKGNIRVISARANLLKSDASVEELEKVLLDLKRIRDEDSGL